MKILMGKFGKIFATSNFYLGTLTDDSAKILLSEFQEKREKIDEILFNSRELLSELAKDLNSIVEGRISLKYSSIDSSQISFEDFKKEYKKEIKEEICEQISKYHKEAKEKVLQNVIEDKKLQQILLDHDDLQDLWIVEEKKL